MAFNVITPVKFGADELAIAASFTTVRTTPVGTRDIIKNIDIANNHLTLAAVVSVHPADARTSFPS